MEKRLVQWLLFASAGLFALAIALAAVARPLANLIITVAGRGSAILAVCALVLFLAFKLGAAPQTR
ncbi:MAG: hypothetical protein WC804_15110 [Sphingomonas sp.]|jgi:hypothetical protein|uniref:hypothetical protein n=1 Tax=Sphingomonas sp. TaxID=28214 RepID=UPI003561655B